MSYYEEDREYDIRWGKISCRARNNLEFSGHVKQGEILTYREVLRAALGENHEAMVDVRRFDHRIMASYEKMDMISYTGERIYVRDAVAKKLARVNSLLSKKGMRLKIVYGYRHPFIQEDYFVRRRAALAEENRHLSNNELDELTHNFVAVPSVAGHPTGGAADVTIAESWYPYANLDMGTEIADYSDSEKIKTFAMGLSETQMENRRLLHDLMIDEGLAPFYGEWWHFSFGDREWARFYNYSSSLYSPVDFRL